MKKLTARMPAIPGSRTAEDSSDLDAARRARLRGTPFQDVTRRPERRTRPSHRDPTGDTAIRRIDKEKK